MNDETDITIRAFTANDIYLALAFWTSIEGLGFAESDSRAGIEAFLMRNPGFSAIGRSTNSTMRYFRLCGKRRGQRFLAPVWLGRSRGLEGDAKTYRRNVAPHSLKN